MAKSTLTVFSVLKTRSIMARFLKLRRFIERRSALQLTLWFLVISVVPLILVLMLTYLNMAKMLQHDIKHSFEAHVENRYLLISNCIETKRTQLQLLARNLSLAPIVTNLEHSNFAQAVTLSSALQDYLHHYIETSLFHDLMFINLSGKVQYSVINGMQDSLDLKETAWQEASLQQAFQLSKKLVDTVVSDISYYPPTGRSAAFIATPLVFDGRLQGVLVGQINDDELYQLLHDNASLAVGNISVGRQYQGQIIDVMAGMRFSQLNPHTVGPDFKVGSVNDDTPMARALRAESGQGVLENHLGEKVYATWRYHPDLRWGIVYEAPLELVYQRVNKLTTLIAIIVVLTLLFIVILSLFIYHYLSEVLSYLLNGIHRFANEEQDFKPLKVHGKNEFSQIARAFNAMAIKLQQSLCQLSNQAKELQKNKSDFEQFSQNLTQLIAEKTRDLEQSRQVIESILTNAPIIVMFKDHQGRYRLINEQAQQRFQLPLEQLLGSDDLDIFPPIQAHIIRTHDRLVMANEKPMQFEEELFGVQFLMSRFMLPDQEGEFSGICSIGIDISEKVQTSDALAQANQLQQSVSKQLTQALQLVNRFVASIRFDMQSVIQEVSLAFAQVTGLRQSDLHQMTMVELIAQQFYASPTVAREAVHLWRIFQDQRQVLIKEGQSFSVYLLLQPKGAKEMYFYVTVSPVFNNKNELSGYQSFWQDKSYEREFYRLSITDELTGLYNRRHFNQRVEGLVKSNAKEAGSEADNRTAQNNAMLIFDIDFFKRFNDFYGHLEGDTALVKIGQLCSTQFLNHQAEAFRMGGEEFAYLIEDTTLSSVRGEAEKFCKAVANLAIPHEKSEVGSVLTISLGLAYVTSNQPISSAQLYQFADQALYQAKQQGRNQLCVIEVNDEAQEDEHGSNL